MKNLISLRSRGVALAAFWSFGMAALGLAGEGALVFQMKGEAVTLPAETHERICGQIESVVVSSSLDSKHFPRFFRRHPPPVAEQIPRDSFLKIEYSEPRTFRNSNGDLQASEVWVIIREGESYPGPIYLVNEEEVVALWKYSGVKLVGLLADDALSPHLPARMQEAAAKAKRYVKAKEEKEARKREPSAAEAAPVLTQ